MSLDLRLSFGVGKPSNCSVLNSEVFRMYWELKEVCGSRFIIPSGGDF